jgi:hypothetical protein
VYLPRKPSLGGEHARNDKTGAPGWGALMEPQHAQLLAQAFLRDTQLSAALHAIAGLGPADRHEAAALADQALRTAPAVVALPPGFRPEAGNQPAHDPAERMLAAFTRLLIAAEGVTDRSKGHLDLLKAQGVLALAVIVAKAEAQDLLKVEGMDAIALAITLQRQNEALRATLEAAQEVVRGFAPGGQKQKGLKVRLLERIRHVLSLKCPLATPFHKWPTAEVVPFPTKVAEEDAGQG